MLLLDRVVHEIKMSSFLRSHFSWISWLLLHNSWFDIWQSLKISPLPVIHLIMAFMATMTMIPAIFRWLASLMTLYSLKMSATLSSDDFYWLRSVRAVLAQLCPLPQAIFHQADQDQDGSEAEDEERPHVVPHLHLGPIYDGRVEAADKKLMLPIPTRNIVKHK